MRGAPALAEGRQAESRGGSDGLLSVGGGNLVAIAVVGYTSGIDDHQSVLVETCGRQKRGGRFRYV